MSEGEGFLWVGPHTTRLAAKTLEQSLGAVWQAIIESHGHDPAEGWEVRIEGLRLTRAPVGHTAPLEGGRTDGAVAPAGASAPPTG